MNNKRRPALRARADGPNARQDLGMKADPDRNRFFPRGVIGFGFDSDQGRD